MPEPKPVAVVTTIYFPRSHADVIAGKILEGLNYDGKNLYGLRVVSMYVDQFADKDMSRDLAKKHGFRLCKTIDEALTLGTDKLAVEGVLSIGEHGTYPKSEKGQTLYPRRMFFEEITKTFVRVKRSVPVFNDKHLAAAWDDAKWMYDRAGELMFPFLAGSTIPITWRKPDLALPKNCELTDAVMLGYGPFEGYGFHAIEGLQCMVERRKGGETGVKAVTALSGDAMWTALDRGEFSKEVLEESIRRAPAHAKGEYRELTLKNKDAGVWVVEYRDGFKAAVAMLNGFLHEGDGGAFCFAGQIKGEDKPRSCQFYLQQPDPYAHFGEQVKAIESMISTGHAPSPVERTLLATGITDTIMTTTQRSGKRVETSHLKVAYRPTEWSHATGPIPKVIKR